MVAMTDRESLYCTKADLIRSQKARSFFCLFLSIARAGQCSDRATSISTSRHIPPSSIPKDDGILIDGELTGHSHRIENEKHAKVFSHRDDLYVIVAEPGTAVIHPEHDRIDLKPGMYRVWRQREFDPLGGDRDWQFLTQQVSTEPYRWVAD